MTKLFSMLTGGFAWAYWALMEQFHNFMASTGWDFICALKVQYHEMQVRRLDRKAAQLRKAIAVAKRREMDLMRG